MSSICTCKICGKEFESGRRTACYCSAVCRLEGQQRYREEYLKLNQEAVKRYQKKWYLTKVNKQLGYEVKGSDNLDLNFVAAAPEPEPIPKPKPKRKLRKYTGSAWAKKYSDADRLTRISMLSWQLSKYGIANLSYGALSCIWDTSKYNALLQKVLAIKKQEERL